MTPFSDRGHRPYSFMYLSWILLFLLLTLAVWTGDARSQGENVTSTEEELSDLHLAEAVMCEKIDNFKPLYPSVIFPVSAGSVMCFSEFDIVPETTVIYHDWIRRDTLVFHKKLVLKPPRWASVSSIKLRETDQGPWRVEIRDSEGNLLSILRFSITE